MPWLRRWRESIEAKIEDTARELKPAHHGATESASTNLDLKSALEIIRIINAEDAKVVPPCKQALPQIARGD